MKNKKPEQKQNLPEKVKKASQHPNPPAAPATGEEEATDASEDISIAFLDTEEATMWRSFCDAAYDAIDAGKERAELPLDFLKLIRGELATDPLLFDELRQAWNRLAGERGEPDRKLKAVTK